MTRNHDLVNELPPTGRVRGDEGLLAHIRGELVAGHRHHLATKLVDDQVPVLRLPMLENILDNVVLWRVNESSDGNNTEMAA